MERRTARPLPVDQACLLLIKSKDHIAQTRTHAKWKLLIEEMQ